MNEISKFDPKYLDSLGIKQPTREHKSELDQTDFLKLMVAQLKNQNPTEPKDGADFLGQMAQFSTLDGISGVSKALMSVTESLQGNKTLEAATLVGKSVGVQTDKGLLAGGRPIAGAVMLENNVQSLTVDIKTEAGELVRTIELGPQYAGQMDFSWNGDLGDGSKVQDGVYRITATALQGGKREVVPVQINALVESVVVNDGKDIKLNLPGIGLKSLSDVKSVSTF